MFVTNWTSTTKIQKISEITNFFRHYFLSRTEVMLDSNELYNVTSLLNEMEFTEDQSTRMINAYFGKGSEKAANTKTCEISF